MLKLSFSSGQSKAGYTAPCLPHMNPPFPHLEEPKFIEIGFGSHSVTIFELPKSEDKYATYNSKPSRKQGIHEMIPAQISVAGKISIRRMAKIFWPIRCMLLKPNFRAVWCLIIFSNGSFKSEIWQKVREDVPYIVDW